MEDMKNLRDMLLGCVQGQFSDGIEHIDTHEMGEVIDMIKDLGEAMYYCKKVEKMEHEIEKMKKGTTV